VLAVVQGCDPAGRKSNLPDGAGEVLDGQDKGEPVGDAALRVANRHGDDEDALSGGVTHERVAHVGVAAFEDGRVEVRDGLADQRRAPGDQGVDELLPARTPDDDPAPAAYLDGFGALVEPLIVVVAYESVRGRQRLGRRREGGELALDVTYDAADEALGLAVDTRPLLPERAPADEQR
jgi:hypothetical protein